MIRSFAMMDQVDDAVAAPSENVLASAAAQQGRRNRSGCCTCCFYRALIG